MELQSRHADITAQGLGLAVITYDSVDTLKGFSDSRGLDFPTLSDEGSAVIQEYGLLNQEMSPGVRFYGVPYPGTFILDTEGRVRERFFEQAYQERFTVSSILVALGDAANGTDRNATRLTTDHLDALAYPTDRTVAPGNRFSLVVDVTPKEGMHLYAPGGHTYQVIRLQLNAPDFIRAHEVRYPASEIYHYKPLDERVEVFQEPFQLVQEVTIPMTPEIAALAAEPDATLTVEGVLTYQACDDAICYTPVELPVRWTLGWRPLVR